jgi:hypothetical protein
MRGTRQVTPALESPWAASILPGVALPRNSQAPAAPAPPAPPAQAAVAPFLPTDLIAAPAFGPAPPVGLPAEVAPAFQFDPDGDLASAPQLPPPPQFDPGPQFGAAPQYGPGPQFGTPQFGTPQFGMPQPFAPAQPMQPGYAPPMQPGYAPPFGGPPPKGGVPTAVWVALAAVGGVVLLMILAAIAIPVFLNQRKPADRPVSIPLTMLGQSQLHNADLDSATARLLLAFGTSGSGLAAPDGAFYGQEDTPTFFVGAAKLTRQLTPAERADLLRPGASFSPTPEGAGPFGGTLECGQIDQNGTQGAECVSVDSAAVVVTVIFDSSSADAAFLTRQIVSSVEGAPGTDSSSLESG